MRYFLELSYCGSNYSGWQRQKNVITVQQVIEEKLSSIFKETITVTGCGRTDAGVHASQYFLHFDRKESWEFDLIFRLNKCLPDDISIHSILPVEARSHARFDARKRDYDYFIHTNKNPFLRSGSTLFTDDILDIDLMVKGVEIIKRKTDFKAFCKKPELHKSTICIIYNVSLSTNKDNSKIRFHIEANHFLRGMIRILVGYLINIGTGKITLETFESYFISNERAKEFDVAPPQGLYLSKIEYPYLKTETPDIFFGQKEESWINRT